MAHGYLLDTNHISEVIRRVSRIRDRIRQVQRQGVRVGTCIPVVCEVEDGIHQTAAPARYRQALDQLLSEVRLWSLDRDGTRLWGATSVELRAMGRVLSHVDIVLVVLARRMNLTILTADRDFEAVPNLRIENWLADPVS